jgi:serine phosphatase RsbU (regulator of sigma subunit)
VIEIAGVKRPFIHFDSKAQKHNYYSIRGKSIGDVFDMESDIPVYKIPYSTNDFFYFFSDGITDQFGGINGKKLMKKRLLEFLDSTKDMPSDLLETELELFLRKWQGTHMQTDDILLIGLNPYQLSISHHLKSKINN